VWRAYVQQDDVGTHLVDQGDGLLSLFRLAHYRDALGASEYCAQPLAKWIVSIYDKHSDGTIHAVFSR
jgi:hypothetical protein